jgi:hypothetical protein
VFPNRVRNILKGYLEFLTRKDQAIGGETLEERFGSLSCFFLDFFPLEFVSLSSRIDSHEPSGVLDCCT